MSVFSSDQSFDKDQSFLDLNVSKMFIPTFVEIIR